MSSAVRAGAPGGLVAGQDALRDRNQRPHRAASVVIPGQEPPCKRPEVSVRPRNHSKAAVDSMLSVQRQRQFPSGRPGTFMRASVKNSTPGPGTQSPACAVKALASTCQTAEKARK